MIERTGGALRVQVYQHFRELILDGAVRPGNRLPATRKLATEFQVSRNTVIGAYEQLAAEGFVASQQGSGYVVQTMERLPNQDMEKPRASQHRSKRAERISAIPDGLVNRHVRTNTSIEFLYGEPSYESFPFEAWARTLGRVTRAIHQRHLAYPAYQGIAELRQAISGYLARARGITASPEEILVVHGTQDAVDLCCQLMIDKGDRVVLEHPYYRGFIKAATAYGAELDFVDVDDHGIRTDQLPESGCMAFVTPSHQFPSGGVLPITRRMELLNWADENNALIVEDDYDGEFRYDGSPIASMKSLDKTGSVVYVGTASKTFFPGLRLGWVVGSEQLIEDLTRLRAIADTTPPAVLQLTLAEFMNSGQFERHVFRVRKSCSAKRQVLLETLNKKLGDTVVVSGAAAGIHVLVKIPQLPANQTAKLISNCQERGVTVHSSDQYYLRSPDSVELILGYNAVPMPFVERGAGIIADEVRRLIVDTV